MVLHHYFYRLKCIVRDKQNMFWTLIFPIVLATLFNLAFSNLSSADNFSSIKIGIVDNEEYQSNTNFIQAMKSVSNSNQNGEENPLFDVQYTSKEEADQLLNNNKIAGYIYFDNGLQLVVKESGINQTIIKSFLDEYQQTSSTIMTIIITNPNVDVDNLISSVSNKTNYLKEVAVSKASPNNTVTYFYALMAMASLYGSFFGLNEVTAIQGNLSSQGARVNIAPTHKFKLFIAAMLAATTVHLFNIFVLLGYLTLILKVDFGSQLGFIALTCFIGTITGVSFGTFVSSFIKKGEGLKIGILIGITMVLSFMSGMMYDGMKYIISSNVPILGYLNPANLITDSFYALYYYSTHTQFFMDIILLCAFTVIFTVSTYLVLRRQQYASL